MELTLYGILVALALFIVLLVFNPRLSCFGRKLKSPFYPMVRKKKLRQKKSQSVDYGFDLGGTGEKKSRGFSPKSAVQKRNAEAKRAVTEDYGFDLGGKDRKNSD